MKFLGVVEGKGLYAEWNEKYSQVRYNLDGVEIGVFSVKSMNIEEPILYKNNTIENELSAEAKDTIQEMAKKIDINELKEDEKKLADYNRERIGKAIGKEKDDLVSITEVDLEEVVEKEENQKDNLNRADEEKLATKKDINIKQELKMDTMATNMKTIGQVLQNEGKIPKISGKNFTKVGIVESDDVKNIDKNAKTNTSRFSLVAIANDGTVVPLKLEQDNQAGNNPRDINYRTDIDGGVEQDDTNTRLKIGKGDATISIKTSNGPGDIEVSYSAHKSLGGKEIEGNENMDHLLQTDSVYYKPRTESKDNEYSDGIRGAEERAQEANLESKHQEELKKGKKGKVNNDSHEYKNTDGDKQTKNSNHKFDIVDRARRLINENDDVASTFTEQEVIDMLEKAHDDGKEIDKAEEDIKEDANMLKTHNR